MAVDSLGGVRHALNSDSAHTLGFAGKKLREAIEALARHDAAAPGERRGERKALVLAAAEALWSYVIQKELLHIPDDEMVNRVFKVPAEVWRQMGKFRDRRAP